jgi:hypothetical protein
MVEFSDNDFGESLIIAICKIQNYVEIEI